VHPIPRRVIAMVNNKGGVGKTTCTLNITAGLARRSRRVLIVDLDPQANASLVLLGTKLFELPRSVYDVLLDPTDTSETSSSLPLSQASISHLPKPAWPTPS